MHTTRVWRVSVLKDISKFGSLTATAQTLTIKVKDIDDLVDSRVSTCMRAKGFVS